MSTFVRKHPSLSVLAIAAALAASPAFAGSFSITSGTTTSAQTLNAGQTGSISSGATLSVSGSSTVAVTISGDNATLTNLGTIKQTGTGGKGRAVRDSTNVSNLSVTNGSATNSTALMQTADSDVIQMNNSGSSVTLNNYGTMTSLNASKGGAQAVDFNAIASGSNVINNFATGALQAQDADAVRPGVNGVVNNYGKIVATHTTDTGDDGIDAQNNTGVTVNNYATGTVTGARHGITGGAVDNTVTFTIAVNNSAGGTIQGLDGSGLNIDGFNAKETATIVNGGLITGNGVTGDGDGVDVDGLVNLTNTGTIRSFNSYSTTTPGQSEGVTVGGGSIVNSGLIEGDVAAGNTNAVGRGITLAGIDTSGTPEPIYANSVITNQAGGVIKGQTDSAIVVQGAASGFTVTINNNAGATLLGGGTTYAAVRTGADNDTINDAGIINGSSSGKAIDMGAGNNTLHITGGQASILGNINGGVGGTNVMTIDPGTGKAFAYAGVISNFNNVEVESGIVTLSGQNIYTGTTRINGGTLVLDGANRVAAASALVLNGGTLKLANAGGANGETFASLSVLDSSTIDLGNSSLTFDDLGAVGAGKTLTVLDWSGAVSPDYALRLLGDFSSNASFLALMSKTTIGGQGATWHFDGTYTNVVAVPEPASYAMLMAALAVVGAMTRRRKDTAGV